MVELRFPPPERAWSLNTERRHHWSWRHRRAREWRDAAFWYARAHRLGPLGPAVVTVSLPVPDGRRRDPSNWMPAVKAIVDGLVAAGVWPDDTPDWVTTTEPILLEGAEEVLVSIAPR